MCSGFRSVRDLVGVTPYERKKEGIGGGREGLQAEIRHGLRLGEKWLDPPTPAKLNHCWLQLGHVSFPPNPSVSL